MAEKWEQRDNLNIMTSKFNDVVQELENLKESSNQATEERFTEMEQSIDDIEQSMTDQFTEIEQSMTEQFQQVDQATEERFTEIEQSMTEQFQQVNEELEQKVSAVTAEDIGLGNVDNTSDIDKPVSTAQQQAIDTAKTEAMADMLTSEEVEMIDGGEDPEVSSPVKEYISNRIKEIGAESGVISYGIAGTDVLGVVKASDDVNVNSSTGKMSIPKLGELTNLQTTDKSTLVAAINETFQLGSEKKVKLVENLTAVGITCSTSDSWETLIGYVLNIFTGTDTSDATLEDTSKLLQWETAYGPNGKVTGTLKDFWGSFETEDLWLHSDDKSVHLQIPETGRYNITGSNVYASAANIAKCAGLTADMLMVGKSVLNLVGTATSDGFIDASCILRGRVGYGNGQRFEGVMPNRANEDKDEVLHPDFPEQSMMHTDLLQYDNYGATTDTMRKLLIMKAPYGYYDGNTRVYATPSEVASVLGITADKIVAGETICEITGTKPTIERTLVMEKTTQSEDDTTRVEIMLSDFPYQYIVVACYASTNFNNESSFVGNIIQNVDIFKSGSVDIDMRVNYENSSVGLSDASTKDRIVLFCPAYHACRVYGVNNISAFK